MKRLCTTALLMVLAACAPTEQQEGQTAYTNRKFDSLDHTGNLTLTDVKVTNALSGSGDLKVEKTHIGSVDWKGAANFQRASVQGDTTVDGNLTSAKSTFVGSVTVEADSVDMRGVTIGDDLDIESDNRGQTTLMEITVSEEVTGTGTLNLTKGRFGDLEWSGPVTITECDIDKDAEFTGTVSLDKVNIRGDVEATSTEIKLNAVQINGNVLIPEVRGQQKLTLTGGTTIKGDVSFASGNGIIDRENGTEIQGKVVGTQPSN